MSKPLAIDWETMTFLFVVAVGAAFFSLIFRDSAKVFGAVVSIGLAMAIVAGASFRGELGERIGLMGALTWELLLATSCVLHPKEMLALAKGVLDMALMRWGGGLGRNRT